jgi:hypothetical protein
MLAAGSLRLPAVCGALDGFGGLFTACPLCWLPRWPVYVRRVTLDCCEIIAVRAGAHIVAEVSSPL